MSKKKLRIVHTEASCGWGGQEIRILTESAGMITRGHDVLLLCPADSTIYREAPKYGVPAQAINIGRKNVKALFAMCNWLLQNGQSVDVINTHSSTDSWLVAIASKLLKDVPPIVRTRHVSSPINKKKSTYWLYQKAVKHIVVTGEPLRQSLAKDNGFSLSSMTSIPTGIDLDRFCIGDKESARRSLGLEQDVVYLGILATLRDWKGHEYLFEALEIVEKVSSNIQLLVIGDGPYRDRLEAYLEKLNVKQLVHFVGQQENPEKWLQALDIFTLPSYGDEGVSQAVMQAMATGLPVVTTNIGGMADAVTDNVTGVFVPAKDCNALAAAISSLLENPARAASLGEAARKKAIASFGTQVMLDKMEQVFTKFSRKASVCAE